MRNVYTKIKSHWKPILKYTTLVGLSLFNLMLIYHMLYYINVYTFDGFSKNIEPNAPEWYYHSEELFILFIQIKIGIFIILPVLSLVFHKKTIISLIKNILKVV